MAPKHKPVEKKFGYSLNYEGFIKLLTDFAPIWEALKLLIEGPVGGTPQSGELVRSRGTFLSYAKPMFEGKLDTYERTICTGAALKNQIFKYIRETLGFDDTDRADTFFDQKCKEIEGLSASVWSEKMDEIGESRARFTSAVQAKQLDLREVVKAYNEVIMILIPTLESLKAEAKKREEAERVRLHAEKQARLHAEKKAKEAEEEKERKKHLYSIGEKALAQLSA